MKLPAPFSWDRDQAREGRFDGKFLIGVMTTAIYCLPSCPARPACAHNIQVFANEDQAKAQGLRACKRCRPDLFYRGEDENLALFEGLRARVARNPEEFATLSSLCRTAGVSLTKLGDLFREHAHLAPAAWLRRLRVQRAAERLLETPDKVADIGFAVGFESESVFHRQFLNQMRMTPGAYRALAEAKIFLLHLPGGYRAKEILSYHDRDPLGVSEKCDGHRIFKALGVREGPCVLEVKLEPDHAWIHIHTERKLSGQSMAALHGASLRMLGLPHDVTAFETRHSHFVRPRRGLRLPLLPSGIDALCWAIIGQQIHMKFASALRREIIEMAGEKIGDMKVHPTAERIANLSLASLTARRYSRAKAQYLIGAAQAVASGKLAIEELHQGSAVAAEKMLRQQRGIGIWTARYVMLRTGFADSVLIGDSALSMALKRLHKLDERPDGRQTAQLMLSFAPFRSLATMHLWTYAREAAA